MCALTYWLFILWSNDIHYTNLHYDQRNHEKILLDEKTIREAIGKKPTRKQAFLLQINFPVSKTWFADLVSEKRMISLAQYYNLFSAKFRSKKLKKQINPYIVNRKVLQ